MKPAMMNPVKRRYGLWFWLGTSVILALNITLWLFVNQVEKRFVQELQARLSVNSRALNALVDSDALTLLTPEDDSSAAYLSLLLRLQSVRSQDSLQSIILYGVDGTVLVAAPEILKQQSRAIGKDSLFVKALRGRFVTTRPEKVAGEWFMAAYAPILDVDGFVAGVQRIETRAAYFETLSTLRERLLLFSVINFVVIGLIAFFLFRMIDRTLRYQVALKDSEHLAQLGTMAAAVAHEIRNPLGIISGTNDLIRKKYGQRDDALFDFIPDEIKRLNTLIHNFLQFARTPQLNPRRCDLATWFGRIKIGLPEEQARRLRTEGLEEAGTWLCDPNVLEQVMLNIIRNAFEAGDEHMPVTVKFRVSKQKLIISVVDQGTGMDAETLNKVTTPFFTTRETGTGLGLAISQHLMQVMNGRLEIRSRPGEGTTVTLTLPPLVPGKKEDRTK